MTLEENGQVHAENFTNLGLPTTFVKATQSPLGATLLFNLVDINDYNERKIKDLIKKQAVYYHLDMQFVATKEAHFGMFVKIKQAKLFLSKLLYDVDLQKMIIGKDADDKDVEIDFDKTPHLLIAGTTGSGKTILLKNLILNIYGVYAKKRRPFVLDMLDTKFELQRFASMKNAYFYGENARTQGDNIFTALEKACERMDAIYTGKLPNTYEHFIIIDELADLMLTTELRGQVEDMIVRLASKGRACGIHLIIATQSPRVAVISGLIKANMPNRIALKTASIRESCIVLEHKGAEALEGSGDAIFKVGLEERHIQIAYPEEDLIKGVIKLNMRR